MKIEILHRVNNSIVVSGDYESIRDCLEKSRDADLRGANLRSANLEGANLRGAYLEGAKNYSQSHDIFQEAVRRQAVAVFDEAEWTAIAQVIIHRLCWDAIKKRFGGVMPSIFLKLADAGCDEWLKHWEVIR